MGIYDDISLKQVRKDWQYLEEKYGVAYDFCGAWCEEDKLRGILLGKAKIKDTIINLIEYYFSKPAQRDRLDFSDEKTLEIKERYYLE